MKKSRNYLIALFFVAAGFLFYSSPVKSSSPESIETSYRWKGLGLCVWPGETCKRQYLNKQ